MSLSFNKCSISESTAPIYQSVEETLKEKTRKSNLNFCLNSNLYVTDHLSVWMYTFFSVVFLIAQFPDNCLLLLFQHGIDLSPECVCFCLQ